MNKLAIFTTLFLSMFLATQGNASIKRQFQDMKMASQQMIEKQSFTNLAAADLDAALDGHAGNTAAAAVVVSTMLAQPDSPRNVVVTPGGTTADVAACVVVVAGTDIFNKAISENFSFLENASTATTGAKAFKTVTSVTFPANCEDSTYGATWDVGYGEKIGMKRCMDYAGHVVFTTIDGAKETTAPTMAASASAVSGNTVDFHGTMNGTSDFELFFFQNFRCFP